MNDQNKPEWVWESGKGGASFKVDFYPDDSLLLVSLSVPLPLGDLPHLIGRLQLLQDRLSWEGSQDEQA